MVQGRYFYYQLNPWSQGQDSGLQFLDAITINLESIVGDADLAISTSVLLPEIDGSTPDTIRSQQLTERFESITLYKSENFTLTRPLYIGVYSSSMAVYEISFIPTYSL